MDNKLKHHLDEDQIIRAVVDESDLSFSVRKHLDHCDKCSARKTNLEKDLACLRKAAQQFVPLPRGRLNLKKMEKPNQMRWLWNWRTALGAALAAAALVMFIWWPGQRQGRFESPGGANLIVNDIKKSESLMTEISILSENALPQVYLDIAVETESDSAEEFINFIAPIIENDSLTFVQGRKGAKLC
ncbi:MAG: hypothetical protein JSU83_04030 [Deltaproteobacteria bacterium]|nr:MAG: hypothetical protein JSU83_04030 [Deltaproteobacteria bacterium]